MFVWAGNANKILVNEHGTVKDANHVRVAPKYDIDGFRYVEIERIRYYVHELVIQNHGKPPHKNRLPKMGETVRFIDGNRDICHIDNLEYTTKKGGDNFMREEGVPKATEEYVWELLKQGKTYTVIQELVAHSNYEHRTISIGKISDIRKKYSENQKITGMLSPSQLAALDAIKRELGETDDQEAKRQLAAREDKDKREAIAKSKEAKSDESVEEIKEVDVEPSGEMLDYAKNLEPGSIEEVVPDAAEEKSLPEEGEGIFTEEAGPFPPVFESEHIAGGYYAILKNGEDVTEKYDKVMRFRKKQSKELVKAFYTDEEMGMKLIQEEYVKRNKA